MQIPGELLSHDSFGFQAFQHNGKYYVGTITPGTAAEKFLAYGDAILEKFALPAKFINSNSKFRDDHVLLREHNIFHTFNPSFLK